MSMTFTKLFSSITDSSIWCQDDHTRLLWITMLAMADKHGRVWASVPGLANRARVPFEAAERALSIFLAPDPHSRTKDHDGRRVEVIDGGWRLLNHAKYRELRDEEDQRAKDAERQRRCRAKRDGKGAPVTPMSRNVTPSHDNADADADANKREGEEHPVQLPRGFPKSEADATKQASFAGCSEDFARQVWNEASSRGGRDVFGQPVVNFRSYLAGRAARERSSQTERRLNGKAPAAPVVHRNDTWK